jgi:hypothetical protein
MWQDYHKDVVTMQIIMPEARFGDSSVLWEKEINDGTKLKQSAFSPHLVGRAPGHRIRPSALEVPRTGLPSPLESLLLADTGLEMPLQTRRSCTKTIYHDGHGPPSISKPNRPASNQSRPVAGPITSSELSTTLPPLT